MKFIYTMVWVLSLLLLPATFSPVVCRASEAAAASADSGRARGPSVTYNVGEPVSVNWKGAWYPAKVIKAEETRWFIHYDNYDNSWDEWVGMDRIKKK